MFGSSSPRSMPQSGHIYDVAVIGAGLAGTELAWRLAKSGQDVLLVSQALDHLGNLYQDNVSGVKFMPESIFAKIADGTTNKDGWAFHRMLKAEIEATAGIHLLQSTVTALDEDTHPILSTWEGPKLQAKKAVIAVGSFLKARLIMGENMEDAGRLSEVSYDFLADDLARSGVFMSGSIEKSLDTLPQYEVQFLNIAATELDGFKLRRFNSVYALGRCVGGKHSYDSVLRDAAELAELLKMNKEEV